jgi:hypothetical protein
MSNARKKATAQAAMTSGNPSARSKGFDRDLTRNRRSVSVVLQGEFGDAGFAELAKALGDQGVILSFLKLKGGRSRPKLRANPRQKSSATSSRGNPVYPTSLTGKHYELDKSLSQKSCEN